VLAKPFELSELLSAVDHARFGHPN
jgi:hypothetical protein